MRYQGLGSGGSFAHGLNAEPEMVVIKARNKTDDWRVYHKGAGTSKYLRFNGDNVATGTNNWQKITNAIVEIDADSAVNSSSYNYLALCFAPVEGYSAFGSYEGNNDADGPFLYTGFRVAFFLVKNIDAGQPWNVYDSTRSPSNVISKGLQVTTATLSTTPLTELIF